MSPEEGQEVSQDDDVFEIILPITIIELSDDEFYASDANDGFLQNASPAESGKAVQTTSALDLCAANLTSESEPCSVRTLCSKTTVQKVPRPASELQNEMGVSIESMVLLTSSSTEERCMDDTIPGIVSSEKEKRQGKKRAYSEKDVASCRRSKRISNRIITKVKDTVLQKQETESSVKLKESETNVETFNVKSCFMLVDDPAASKGNKTGKSVYGPTSVKAPISTSENLAEISKHKSKEVPPSELSEAMTDFQDVVEVESSSTIKKEQPLWQCSESILSSTLGSCHLNIKKEKCQKCSLSFTSDRLLKVHFKSEHMLKRKCGFCHKRYANLKNHLEAHLRAAHCSNTRQAVRQSAKTGEQAECEDHIGLNEMDASTSMETNCITSPRKQCSFSTRKIKRFLAHLKSHGINTSYQCPNCDYAALKVSKIKKHLHGHVGVKFYRCTHGPEQDCGVNHRRSGSLALSDTEPFRCELCKSESRFKFKQHVGAPGKKKFKKHKCDIMFLPKEHLFYQKLVHSIGVQTTVTMKPLISTSDPKLQLPNSVKLYECEKCEYTTSKSVCFKKHIPIHAGGKRFKCNRCKKIFRTRSRFIRHKAGRITRGLYKCKKCCYSVRSIKKFGVHWRKHQRHNSCANLLQPLEASSCNEQDLPLSSSNCHGDYVDDCTGTPSTLETSSKLHKCQHCGYVAYHSHNFIQHVRIHTGEKTCKCESCSKCFRTRSHLVRHKSRCFPNGHRSCKKCRYSGRTGNDGEDRQCIHGDSTSATVFDPLESSNHDECEVSLPGFQKVCFNDEDEGCGEGSNRLQSGAEMLSKHKCLQCDYMTNYLYNLRQHVRIHTGEKPYKCDLCEKAFRTSSHLVTHRHTHFTNTLYECEKCCFCGTSQKDLEEHPCKQPGNSHDALATSKHGSCDGSLCESQHPGVDLSRAGNENRLLTEEVCLEKNNNVQNRKVTSKNNLKCQRCEYVTSESYNLKQHERIHTGEKPYLCHLCDKHFCTNSQLNRHMKTHFDHGLYKCKKCAFSGRTLKEVKVHSCSHQGNFSKVSVQDLMEVDHQGECSTSLSISPHPSMDVVDGLDPQKAMVVVGSTEGNESSPQTGKVLPERSNRFENAVKTSKKCHQCQYRTSESYNLRQHERIHSGEKPCICDVCGKAFRTRSHLSRHKLKCGKSKYFV